MPLPHHETRRLNSQRGIALITTLLVMMLMSALMVGFTAVVMSNQRYRFVDRDRVNAFYAAHSGLEKLNADLANLFFRKVAPSDAEVAALGTTPPTIPNVTFAAAGGGVYTAGPVGPARAGQITTGPYQGLIALKRTYALDSTAHTVGGGEVHLNRKVETVAIPVFQFGIFSDVDQSFFAGPNFDFGGRVHTNGNLFVAEGNGSTLTLRDKVTVVKEVIRQQLQNGISIDTSSHTGTVKVATTTNAFRDLLRTEGSVTGGEGSSLNPSWPTISLSSYNGNIRNGRTGARALNLPLVTMGATNSDLVRRPPVNEDISNAQLFAERFFSQMSVRILLSDTAADITSLPTVTQTAPVLLDGNWSATAPAGYGPVDAAHPPIARTMAPYTATLSAAVTTGTTKTIPLGTNLPNYFRLPTAMRIRRTNGTVINNVTCTGKTPNSLTGCSPSPSTAAPANSTLEADITTVDGPVTVSIPLSNAWQNPSTTINLGNGSSVTTTALSPGTFWVQSGSGPEVLVTCTGYDLAPNPDVLNGCNVTTALSSGATVTSATLSNGGIGTIGGYIKIELQDEADAWHDVTLEVLNWGIAGPNLSGKSCGDPTPNAIVRLQRLRDNAETGGGACTYPLTGPTGSPLSSEYWPNVLFDAREALQRDVSPGSDLILGGVMHYVTIDVGNLSKWLKGTAPYTAGTGATARNIGGYSVYFSDRRNNRNAANQETGEYGFEDVVNPLSGSGTPNATLDTGEDVNMNGVLDTYGQFPNYNGVTNTVPPGALAPLNASARPTTHLSRAQAQVNRPILYRRALKLTKGGLGNIVDPGLTFATENPAYIEGDWNANQAGFGNPHVATAVIGDAVTLLSNNWSDQISFTQPYSPGSRTRGSQTYYRVAIISGKGRAFPHPNNTDADFGTDGGAHNVLRYLESGGTVNYRGSIVTFYYNVQGVGTYKCCDTVYGAPTRAYAFDIDFLDPAKLPPLTPVFRDVNTLGFIQEVRPGR